MTPPRNVDSRPGPQSRLAQLDVLRGVAVVLVLFRHAAVAPEAAGSWRALAVRLFRLGWTGVDLFFVLSGFLIGGLLLDEQRRTGTIDVARFFQRRVLKIWPPYFALLAYCIVPAIFTRRGGAWAGLCSIVPNLLHVQNYFPTPLLHTWSLAVEEHFYAILPPVLLLLASGAVRGAGLKVIPMAAVVLALACLIMRAAHRALWPADGMTVLMATHLRIDGLFFGVTLAYLNRSWPGMAAWCRRRRGLLLVVGAAFVLPMAFVPYEHPFTSTVGFTLLFVGYGATLSAVLHAGPDVGVLGRLLHSRVCRPLAWIGVFSYGTYLWHPIVGGRLHAMEVAWAARQTAGLHWLTFQSLYVASSVAVGAVVTFAIERPFLALRSRWFPADRGAHRVGAGGGTGVPAERPPGVRGCEPEAVQTDAPVPVA